MPLYKVTIQRSFDIEIKTDDQYKASQLAESFLGYCDDSSEQDRVRNKFSIQSIKMLENNVIEAAEAANDEFS